MEDKTQNVKWRNEQHGCMTVPQVFQGSGVFTAGGGGSNNTGVSKALEKRWDEGKIEGRAAECPNEWKQTVSGSLVGNP